MKQIKKIRKGNDIHIVWRVYQDKEMTIPYDLTGKHLSLKHSYNGRNVCQVADFSINGNAVIFTFYGKDQERTGVYTLTLVENEGLADMHTVDSCDAFQLVARSCDVDGDACGCGNIEVESVELTSTLSADVVANYPSVGVEVDSEMSDTSENPVQNKVVKKYVDDVANVATTPIYEALATIADEVMTRDKDAVEGNVAVFDGYGYAVDSGKSVEDFKGADGEDGVGVPAGGSAGQVLSKKSDADYDTKWVDIPQGGGGDATTEGAVLYTPQTLTDEQKSQVAKNIGQPRERLIVEWSNEDAEVLQPTAYDTESGLFEVETMPSWLAEDGAIVNSCINYSSTVLQTDVWNTCPKPQGNEASGFYIKRITETQVMLFTDSKAEVAATIPSTVKAEHFYFNQAIAVGLSLPQLSEGVKRYRIVLENVGYVPSKYKRMSVSGHYTYIGSNISPNFYDLGLGYVSQEVVLSNIDIILLVDHGEYTARYESIKCEATLRTGDDKAEAKVYRTLFGEMQAIYYANKPNITFGLSGARIKANSTIKLYEIVE